MARFSSREEERRNTANISLSQYLNRKVEPIVLEGDQSTDDTFSTNDFYRESNFKYKNETCSTNSCTHLKTSQMLFIILQESGKQPRLFFLILSIVEFFSKEPTEKWTYGEVCSYYRSKTKDNKSLREIL